jgi:hypothetical protein
MVPFPIGFEIPKFDKYKGTRNIVDHIREFNVHYMDVDNNESHLVQIFPRNLVGFLMD